MAYEKLTLKQEAFCYAYIETGSAALAAKLSGLDMTHDVPKVGCYVYALLCPDHKRLVYIGKGTGRRMHHHLRDARLGRVSGLSKYKAIQEILAAGRRPVPVVLVRDLTSADAFRIERLFIAAIGRDNLTNGKSGRRLRDEIDLAEINHIIGSVIPFDEWCASCERSTKDMALYWAFRI